jgi:cyclopropane fatty-acyl-phospholipid synthase-like methyltransferase
VSWRYDEMQQVGTDFADEAEVSAYDERQGVDDADAAAILDRLGVARGTRFVELGCGTGWLAIRAAQRGAVVTAVDVSPAMLAAARRNAAREGAALELVHGGFLTFTPGSPVDAVASCFALHHLGDFWKQAALLRVADMLAPDGRLFLRDVVFSFCPDAADAEIERWIEAMTHDGAGWSRGAFETHVRDEQSTYAWILRGLLERAGFHVDEHIASSTYADYLCSLAAES